MCIYMHTHTEIIQATEAHTQIGRREKSNPAQPAPSLQWATAHKGQT